mmetsp:Transcript_605/g.1061  ORF Transcript_605/g.1061 Transcript_605/m.1061 type:complete len:291 (-) Transcript_605:94-966(-)
MGLGYTIVINMFNPDGTINPSMLNNILLVQAISCTAGFVGILIFLTSDNPPTPPSAAEAARFESLPFNTDRTETMSEETPLKEDHTKAQEDTNPSYWGSLRLALRHALAFVFVFAFTVGTFYCFPTFISQYVPAATWSSQASGWLGFLFQTGGVVGSVIVGPILDRYENHVCLGRSLLVGAAVSFGVFWLVHDSSAHWLVFLSLGLAGSCLGAFSPLGFDLAASIAYPANEAIVGTLLQFVTNIISSSSVTIGGMLGPGNRFLAVEMGCIVTAFILFMSISVKSRRPRDD